MIPFCSAQNQTMNHWKAAVGCGLFCALMLSSSGLTSLLIAQERPAEIQRTSMLMGTRATVQVYAEDRAEAVAASDAVLQEIARVEALLSTWIPDSELSRINRLPIDIPTTMDPEVAGWLAELNQLSAETAGAFNPVVGALIDAWDLRGNGKRPTQRELKDALLATGAGAFQINSDKNEIARLHSNAWIDAGGFGKGIALRLAADTLKRRGASGVIDLGGQLVVVGEASRRIELTGPLERSNSSNSVLVQNASVATSGLSERAVLVDRERLGHILDPRNGRPVIDWGVVTVVAEDPLVADVLSTALFVLGPENGKQLAESFKTIGVLFQERPTQSRTSEAAHHRESTGYHHKVSGRAFAIHINHSMQELFIHHSRD